MNNSDLISPMAAHQSPRQLAPRLSEISGTIVLSDSMLNVNAGWGELILNTVEDTLTHARRSPTSTLTIERISRPQIGDHRPHEWIDQLLQQEITGVVVTAGDCATCTSRALRECILAEEAGIPATAVVPEGLREIIDATLHTWGRPDLVVATFPTPLFALKRSDFPEAMEATAARVVEILTRNAN